MIGSGTNSGKTGPMLGTRQDPSLSQAGRVRWRHSLRTRIALLTGALIVAVLLLVTIGAAWYARRAILDEARLDVRASSKETVDRLGTMMQMVTITTRGVSDLVANSDLDSGELMTAMRAMVRATPDCAGGLLILESDDPAVPAFAHYISAHGADRDFIANGYDFRSQAWYRRTIAAPDGWWSDAYFNETAGNVWMLTYNRPLRREGAGVATRGMVSLDVPLSSLKQRIEPLARTAGWRAGLISPSGTLADYPGVDVADNLSLPQFVQRSGRSDLQPLADAAAAPVPHFAYLSHTAVDSGEKYFTVIEPVDESGWKLLVSQASSPITARLEHALWLLLAGGVLLTLVCMLLISRMSRRISQPLEQLTAAAAGMVEGHYETPVSETPGSNEVGVLARTLEQARLSIRQQMDEIEDMAAARQKLESELSIARDIQQAMLPRGRVIGLGGALRLEVGALLEPAKTVGGDFYSFVDAEEGALWFAIGDVSDKGVPAALFMARTVTVLEVAARGSRSPDQVLAEASRQLVEGNDTCMFVTVLFGRIDLHSGECALASAGHERPLLLHADGRCETLPVEAGPPLGFEVSEDFPVWHGRLPPEATLVAYTDGVTEAFNPDNVAFGSGHLVESLQPELDVQGLCDSVAARVHAFAKPAPQSDDITLLAMRLHHDPHPTPSTTRQEPLAC